MAGNEETRLLEVSEGSTGSGSAQARPAATAGPATATPAAPESWGVLDPEVWDLTFSSECNSVYHLAREAFYDGCHAWRAS